VASSPARATDDLTGAYDYERLVAQEREHFLKEGVTPDLRLRDNDFEAWRHYWLRIDARIGAELGDLGDLIARRHAGSAAPVRILSLGSGPCGIELALARRLRVAHEITCTDLEERHSAAAKAVAAAEGLRMTSEAADMNFMEIAEGAWDVVFAHASLHHVINLERLFGRIAAGLRPGGILHVVEVVGQNRKLIWDENERFARVLLRTLPRDITRWTRFRPKVHDEGMEGVRQEDILPLLHRFFTPIYELRHGAFMRFICTHRKLSRRLHPADPERRKHLDFLIDADEGAVRRGILRPLELWGVYEPKRSGQE
jgi:SAM-dependent methyltransferase